ncbi:hypothetical protein CDCA_CDCA09G2682 [Cyanidium caldarium]|uniref:Uncharacterized protein n=1 Tax=Cyanidium caldarium TaxID=2771 RepID=A0AAV9IWE4_CYACA|nr:hypothetical protein CDCA_CDCA09G2682 [Cyanidium caldarium]
MNTTSFVTPGRLSSLSRDVRLGSSTSRVRWEHSTRPRCLPRARALRPTKPPAWIGLRLAKPAQADLAMTGAPAWKSWRSWPVVRAVLGSERSVVDLLSTPVCLGGRSTALAAFTYSDVLLTLFLFLTYRQTVRFVGLRVLKPGRERLAGMATALLIPEDEHGLQRWLDALERSVGLFLLVRVVVMVLQIGVVAAARIGLTVSPALPHAISSVAQIGFAGYVVQSLINWFLLEQTELSASQKFVLGRIASMFVTVVAFLLCVEFTGVPLRSVLAFGGIGGLAVGLAAQELAKNFISGFMLAVGAPFAPGESVQLNALGVAGTVRTIGFYKTELIGPDGRPTWIPNSQLVNERLTNGSRITQRRFAHTFGVRYMDIDKVERIVTRIQELLESLPSVDRSSVSVHFVGYTEYALQIQASCFFDDTDGGRFMERQQLALIGISDCIRAEGADFALPVRIVESGMSGTQLQTPGAA